MHFGLVRFYISGEKYYHIHCVALERGTQWQVGYWTMQDFNERVTPAAFFCAISGENWSRANTCKMTATEIFEYEYAFLAEI